MNPFQEWREDQQTANAFARNREGKAVPHNSPNAVCWCARGWIKKCGISDSESHGFSGFLMERFRAGIIMSNDELHLGPREFEERWNQWKEAA